MPVIGRRYWVPCVRFRQMLWPVIGPSHSDVDLGTPEEHMHCDGRFLSERQIQVNLDALLAAVSALPDIWIPQEARDQGLTIEQMFEMVRRSPNAVSLAVSLALPIKNVRPPTLHVRVCKRVVLPASPGWFLPALELQYATAKAPDCRTCPHRGMPLIGQPTDEEGGVVCPAHGLRWSGKDGSLMRRTCPPNLPTASAAKQYRDALRRGQGFEVLP